MYKPYGLLLRTVLSSLLLSAPSVAGQQCQPSDKILLTGSEQGYYYKLGRAIGQVAEPGGLHLCVQPTDYKKQVPATGQNILDLETGKATFSIAQSDLARDAWYGHPPAFNERVTKVRIVMPLYVEAVHILLAPDLNISRLEDLKGRRVGLFLAGSGTEYTAKRILQDAGLKPEGSWKNFDAITTTDPKFCHSVQNLLNGTLDALFRVTVVRSAEIQDALRESGNGERDCPGSSEIKLLPLDYALVERLADDGSYSETLISKHDYNQNQSTLTVGVQALLLAGPKASPDDVEKLAGILRSKHGEIENALGQIVETEHAGHNHPQGYLPRLSLLNIPMAELSAFVHPRAREYLYHPWRDSWKPELPVIFLTLMALFLVCRWKRAALGFAIEKQPNLMFAVACTLLLWLVGALVLNHSEWRVNEHFNSFPRSLVSTFLYLAGFSDYVLLTSGGQQFAQIAKWISLALLGGFASPLLKQALDALLKRVADRLQRIENVSKAQAGPSAADEQEAPTPHFGAEGVADAMAPGAD